jgi:glutamine amidotransferase
VIAIVDYGMGNLRSVQKALQKLGYDAQIASDAETVFRADKVILPGVGAFGAAMENLRRAALDAAIRDFIATGKPFLGICLGLQLLFEVSEESWKEREEPGLGVLRGRVVRFPEGLTDGQGKPLKVPHIGWNVLHFTRRDTLFEGIDEGLACVFCTLLLSHSRRGGNSHRNVRLRHTLLLRGEVGERSGGAVSPGKKQRGGLAHSAQLRGAIGSCHAGCEGSF